MRVIHAEKAKLTQLRDDLAVFDPLDLTAKIAALQLMPENSDRLVRLSCVAGMVASIAPGADRPHVSVTRLRRHLNEAPLSESEFARGEDPFNNPFAETLTFYGGSYMMFPGVDQDDSFVFRHLAKAIFQPLEPFSTPGFLDEALSLCLAVLTLSDEIARRADLDQGTPSVKVATSPIFAPSPEAFERFVEESGTPLRELEEAMRNDTRALLAPPGDVMVPASERFSSLRNAVTLTRKELDRLLVKVGVSPETFDSLVLPQGSANLDTIDPNDNPLFAKPLVHDGGDRYVVAAPRFLVLALCNALVGLAQEHKVEDQLISKYRLAVLATVERSLSFLGNELLSVLEFGTDRSSFQEGMFGLDRDKVIHVILATDDLSQYHLERATSSWPLPRDLSRRLQNRLEKAEIRILDRPGAPNEILHLVLIQGIVPGVVISEGSYPSLSCPVLTMSASDLEVIALVEGEDQLTLWKYRRAHDRVREQRPVRRISTQLDEFHHYRRNGYNYYFTDRRRSEPMLIPMGGSGALRREVQERHAFHGVTYHEHSRIIEVTSLYDDSSIPIYVPWRGGHLEERVEIFVDALPISVWIVGPETLHESRYRHLYFHFTDMIAYWLWRLAPGLSPHLRRLADHCHQILMNIDVVPDEGWFGSEQGLASGTAIQTSVDTGGNLRLQLRSQVIHLLEGPDNVGERELMRRILEGLRDLHAASLCEVGGLTDIRIKQLLDRYVPLGRAKKLLFLRGHRSIEHQEQGLPRLRKVQSADVSDVLDDLGTHLASTLNIPVGRIPDNRRTEILGEAVSYLFGELKSSVSTLSSEELLEWLVAHDESILHKQADHGLLIPVRIACFGSESEMVELLRKERPELSKAALASRFLIEYVAARPPQGVRTLSMSVYDRLMALSSEIINLGMIRDAVNFGIADLKLSMLRSGRIGMHDESYEEARDQFMGVYLAGEIYRSTSSFDRHWREPDRKDKPEDADEIDTAVQVEFGLTLTELLEFLIEATNVGGTLAGDPKKMLITEFLDKFEEELGWDRSRIEKAFEIFASRPRNDFLTPPTPFQRTEVYPWRFNRELSYLRRPLLVRPIGDKNEVVWGVRHCLKAFDYLIRLCVGGRLKAKTSEMKSLISKSSDQDAKEFNDLVADFYETKPGWAVRRRVKKIGRRRIERAPGQDLGDIDVLAADAKKRVLWAVEVKKLAFARNPAELANELENTFLTRGKKRAAVDKHLERVAWLRDNLALTLESLGLPASEVKRRWKVVPLVVVDHELQSPYFVRSPAPVVPFRELEAWHQRKR